MVREESIRKLASSANGLTTIKKALDGTFAEIERDESLLTSDTSALRGILSTICAVCCEQSRTNIPDSLKNKELAFEAFKIELSIMLHECGELPKRVSSAIAERTKPMHDQLLPVSKDIHNALEAMRELRQRNINTSELKSVGVVADSVFYEWVHPTFMALNKLALALWKNLPQNSQGNRTIPNTDLGDTYKLVRKSWLLLTGQQAEKSLS